MEESQDHPGIHPGFKLRREKSRIKGEAVWVATKTRGVGRVVQVLMNAKHLTQALELRHVVLALLHPYFHPVLPFSAPILPL